MNVNRWILACLLAASPVTAQSWVQGQIGFRLTVVPKDCPAERAGLKVGDILADPEGIRAAIQKKTPFPVFRFDPAKAAYQREDVELKFRAAEERKLGVVGDLGFLVTAVEPKSLAARAKLQVHDFLPQIDGSFVHDVSDLGLVDRAFAEGIDVNIHVTRWVGDKFEKSIIVQKYKK